MTTTITAPDVEELRKASDRAQERLRTAEAVLAFDVVFRTEYKEGDSMTPPSPKLTDELKQRYRDRFAEAEEAFAAFERARKVDY